MKTIYLTHPYQQQQIQNKPIILALGFFDGIHKGHQAVIQTAKKIAQNTHSLLAVMSFDQHPSILFQQLNPQTFHYVSPLQRKQELLEELGVDLFYVVRFTKQFAALTPQQFVDQYIVGLHAQTVVAGFDYTYGKKEIANMSLLPTYSKQRFEIITVPEQRNQFGKIGSTQIKQALLQQQIEKTNHYLGYVYQISGTVVHGFGRGGKLLGYPTANIAYEQTSFLPGRGVYVVEIRVEETWYLGMASIGLNPTFSDVEQVTVEVHIFNFNRDIYGEEVAVAWHHFLRPELKFESITDLVKQLQTDEADTKAYFLNHQSAFEVKSDVVFKKDE